MAEKQVIRNGSRWRHKTLADELEAALASPGPSLREKVEGAVAELRRLASSVSDFPSIVLEDAADLVQAALEGE